jgi:diamine N-acetyltransferase
MKIEKISEEHLKARCEWLNSPEIYMHMNIQYPITLEETKKWFERTISNDSRIDLVFKDNEEIVSMTGLTNLDLTNGLVEFYIMVNPKFQKKGYGKKSTIFTINWAFCNYNIHKIYLYTNGHNKRANSLYENLGFELEGTLRKHKFKNGQLIDRNIYGLLKEDWVKNSNYNDYILLNFQI